MTGTMDALGVGSALFDRDERITACCGGFAELAGRPSTELLGVWIADLVERENYGAGRWLIEQLWATSEPFTFLSQYRRPDGLRITVESRVMPAIVAAGPPSGIILARRFNCSTRASELSVHAAGAPEYVADMTDQLAALASAAQMPVTCDLLTAAAQAARREAAVSD